MTENTAKKQRPDHFFKPGVSGNPKGRPKGSTGFATKFRQAIEKLAESNDISANELELQIVQMGIKKAREGDYSFYKDTFDRVYGKPTQKTELTGKDGDALRIETVTEEDMKEIMSIYGANTSKEESDTTESV